MKTACVLISFNRPEYLKQVLNSLKQQKDIEDQIEFYSFQDGPNEESDKSLIEQNINLIKQSSIFKQTRIYNVNLGVALMFDKVEKYLFEELNYKQVIFLEDDMVLSPYYLNTMLKMFDKYKGDNRIGMISAYGYLPSQQEKEGPSLQNQKQTNSLVPMHHNWGFGLTYEFWKKRQVFVQEYLDKFIYGINYRDRDHSKIREWLRSKDYKTLVTSQDGIKNCATVGLNAIRVSCFQNYATFIGENGLHCNSFVFKNLGLDKKTYLFEEPLNKLPDLTDEFYNKLLSSDLKEFKF